MSEFHVEHNARPEIVRVILHCARNGDKERLAVETGKSLRTIERMLPMIRQMGLLHDGNTFATTELGERVAMLIQQSPALFPEVVHHLLYTAHTFDETKRRSWAYARVVNALWGGGERALDGKAKAQLVGTVVDEAAQTFNIPIEQIVFSDDSVRGVLNWLRALDPPVVNSEGRTDLFHRRYFCPPPMFLWAVDFLYCASSVTYGVRLFLTLERIEQLCKLCVLDPSGLDNVLMMAKRMSDYERGGVFDYGTEGGFGRWLLLAHPCPVPMLPER
ncbi:MAG: hypothetical protein HY314_09075 [Acidobacteria bacterium]|nr:hypothetical protein [Acidobacteriota bacterium]